MASESRSPDAAWKSWLGYCATTLVLSVIATFIVRGVWGGDSPVWYFLVSGATIGTLCSVVWIKAGWWD